MMSRSARTLAGLALAALTLSSCFTGERPSFEDEGEPDAESLGTGSVDVDVVLDRLDSSDDAAFTATYTIDTKFGALTSTATVVSAADGRRSVTVERPGVTTRFRVVDGDEQTCDAATGECESSLNDARISDVGIPHTFYGPSFARRLRVSADRRIAESAAYTEPIAGQDARCVDVTVAGGTETFCALDDGPLARFVGADVTVELTGYSRDVDPTAFDPT